MGELRARFLFNTRQQGVSESLEDYVRELSTLCSGCGYQRGENGATDFLVNRLIRDRLLAGIRNKLLPNRILELGDGDQDQDTSLEKAVDLLKAETEVIGLHIKQEEDEDGCLFKITEEAKIAILLELLNHKSVLTAPIGFEVEKADLWDQIYQFARDNGTSFKNTIHLREVFGSWKNEALKAKKDVKASNSDRLIWDLFGGGQDEGAASLLQDYPVLDYLETTTTKSSSDSEEEEEDVTYNEADLEYSSAEETKEEEKDTGSTASGNLADPEVPEEPAQQKEYSVRILPSVWLKDLRDNFDTLFLSHLPILVQEEMKADQRFTKAMSNANVCSELVNTAFVMNGKVRPNLEICQELASILREKNPANFGQNEIVLHDNVELDRKAQRGRGGMFGNKFLGKRLHSCWYEANRRQRVKDDKYKNGNMVEEDPLDVPEESVSGHKKKRPKTGGRTKTVFGMNSELARPSMAKKELEKQKKILEDMFQEDQVCNNDDDEYKRCQKIFNETCGFIQHEFAYNSAFSLFKLVPMFFSDIRFLNDHFQEIAYGCDVLGTVRAAMDDELDILERFLLVNLPRNMQQKLKTEKQNLQGDLALSGAVYAVSLLKYLAQIWKEDITSLIFESEIEDQCKPGCAEPHLVVLHGDFGNLALYSDYTKVMCNLDIGSGMAALVALHFAMFVKYSDNCHNLKTYIQEEWCRFARPKQGTKKPIGLAKLQRFQLEKSEIVLSKYHGMTLFK